MIECHPYEPLNPGIPTLDEEGEKVAPDPGVQKVSKVGRSSGVAMTAVGSDLDAVTHVIFLWSRGVPLLLYALDLSRITDPSGATTHVLGGIIPSIRCQGICSSIASVACVGPMLCLARARCRYVQDVP